MFARLGSLGCALFLCQAVAWATVCDVNQDGQTNVSDIQLAVNQALSITSCTADVNHDGHCDVTDLQLVVDAVLHGGTCNESNASSGCGPVQLGVNGSLGGMPLLSPSDPINQDISGAAVDSRSAAIINFIGASVAALHPVFGGDPLGGYPYLVVPSTQPTVTVTSTAYGVKPPNQYPIPLTAPIEGGSGSTGDRHVYVIQCNPNSPTHLGTLWELYNAHPTSSGWNADSAAYIDLSPTEPGPSAWDYGTSAANIPKLPALVRYEEVATGSINHALLFTAPVTFKGWTSPARSSAGSSTDPSAPPMGMRVRLKASFDVSRFSASNQTILKALKKYGMILDDNGAAWFLEGTSDPHFDDNDLHNLLQTHGSDFEVIQMGPITPQPW